MGRSRASKDQMGFREGVVPKCKPNYAMGGTAQPVKPMNTQKPSFPKNKPIARTNISEKSH